MLSGNYWPAHPHPMPGESLSCWIVRIAHANGLKVQTFCDRVFGKKYQVWNRDIDRNAPDWLLMKLGLKTGTPLKQVRSTTARLYEKRLFPFLHSAGQLRWFMPIKKHHRVNTGYAQQYCPRCLNEDPLPYFRLSWRLALYTFCPKHQVMMADRCQFCNAPIAYHRVELGKPHQFEVETLDCCWQCAKPLSEAITKSVMLHPKLVKTKWTGLLRSIDRQLYPAGAINFKNLTLLHQLCRVLNSIKHRTILASYICHRGNYKYPEIQHEAQVFEQRDIIERHNLSLLAWWLLTHKKKLRTAIRERAIRSSQLYRDLSDDDKEYMLNTVISY